jgi:hypothetical protein
MGGRDPARDPQTLRVMWLGFVGATTLYALVPYVLLAGAPTTGALPSAVRSGLFFAAAGAVVSSFIARRWWTNSLAAARLSAGTAAEPDNLRARLTAGCVVTWGVAELIPIMGLVSAVVWRDSSVALPFAVVGLLTLYWHRPAVWPLDAGEPVAGQAA